MHVLSTVFRVVVQIAIVIVVPGGLPAVLIYQYRRLQKRRRDASLPLQPETTPENPDTQPFPESPQ
ncbi:MAG TPA: hypothetical protein VLC10_00170 [Patescibacteria group bacterium]|nr:hypothetical protein [Patescibacteria group bacterium]